MAEEKKGVIMEDGDKLTYEQLSALCEQMEHRIKDLVGKLQVAQKQLAAYQMQDYYQRAGLLMELVKMASYLDDGFIGKVHAELEELVFPKETDKVN